MTTSEHLEERQPLMSISSPGLFEHDEHSTLRSHYGALALALASCELVGSPYSSWRFHHL
jgi:hypothetical protein